MNVFVSTFVLVMCTCINEYVCQCWLRALINVFVSIGNLIWLRVLFRYLINMFVSIGYVFMFS